jgi:hypothetical protein
MAADAAPLVQEARMDMDGGDIAGVIGGIITLLGVVGGGVKWLFTSRTKREEWIETRIQSHVAKIEARLIIAERRADHLGFAFQLVAAELARLDPNSDILRRAQLIIEGVQGVFADGAPLTPYPADPRNPDLGSVAST